MRSDSSGLHCARRRPRASYPLAEVTNDHRDVPFPFVGLTLAVTWAIALALAAWPPLLAGRSWARALVIGAGALLIAGHAAGTWQRNEVWRTEESLWLDVTRKSPENGRGLIASSVIQMGKGDYDAAQQYSIARCSTSRATPTCTSILPS